MANEVAGPGGCPECGVPEGALHVDTCLRVARVDYEDVFGKKPFHGWSTSKLREMIADRNEELAKTEPFGLSESPSAETGNPTVMLLCDHVYLPEDATSPDWAGLPTVKYTGLNGERRARVVCHPSLAAFLQKRKQAEIL